MKQTLNQRVQQERSGVNPPRSPALPAVSGLNPTGRGRRAGGESGASQSRLPRGAWPRLPRGLPRCVFRAPRPPGGFTSPSYSEMRRPFLPLGDHRSSRLLKGGPVLAWGRESPGRGCPRTVAVPPGQGEGQARLESPGLVGRPPPATGKTEGG